MKLDIVRAWKDEAYRESLSQQQKALLPANPAGELEMSDADLATVVGAGGCGHNGDCNYDPCNYGHRRSHHHNSHHRRELDGGYEHGGRCHSSKDYLLGVSFGLGCN
jgi:mersacidin/lichenicidin family type 2 lantibiotic